MMMMMMITKPLRGSFIIGLPGADRGGIQFKSRLNWEEGNGLANRIFPSCLLPLFQSES